MKVLASPENKRIYTEDDIRQFVGLYHLGALNPTDDPVLTAIVLEELHKDNEEPQGIKPLSLKQKILKYTCLFIFAGFFLSLIIVLLYIANVKQQINYDDIPSTIDQEQKPIETASTFECIQLKGSENNTYCHSNCNILNSPFKNGLSEATRIDSITKSLALINIAYNLDGNQTLNRFCMGIFFEKEVILASKKCLHLSVNESMLNVYAGFESWDINATANISEANPNLITYEIESIDKKLKKKYWQTAKNNEKNNRKRKHFWKNYFDLTFITLVKDKKYIGSNKDISIKYPCYRNDKIKESSQIVYLSMIENRLSTTLYPFKAFEESPTVCSLKNNQTSVKVCENAAFTGAPIFVEDENIKEQFFFYGFLQKFDF